MIVCSNPTNDLLVCCVVLVYCLVLSIAFFIQIGAIDGTLVAIQSPAANDQRFQEANYYSHKGYHAINTMIVCDADKRILSINALSPGANHDSTIWRYSSLRRYAESSVLQHGEWLLGAVNSSTCYAFIVNV